MKTNETNEGIVEMATREKLGKLEKLDDKARDDYRWIKSDKER